MDADHIGMYASGAVVISNVQEVVSNIPARNSGTQSLSLSTAEHAWQQQFPGLFLVHTPSCLCVLLRVTRPLRSLRGVRASFWVCPPGGVRIPLPAGSY